VLEVAAGERGDISNLIKIASDVSKRTNGEIQEGKEIKESSRNYF